VASEANAAALLSHANVAHLLDLGARGPWSFVVTEHVEGCTLAHVLRSGGPLPWTIGAHIASEAARGLSYAHARRRPSGELLRLVHRRITPERIALSVAGDVKLTGFGTSWAWGEREAYRSPEARRNEPIDGRADVFALGVTLQRSVSAEDTPAAVRRAIELATHDYPEHRMTAAQLHEALREALHASALAMSPRDIAALVTDCAARDAALRSA
jgi:serine/threonine protein kinase